MRIEDKFYETAIKAAEIAKNCFNEDPAEAIKRLDFATKYVKHSKQSLPEEYQKLHYTLLENAAKKNFDDARNEMQNNKPRETSKCLSSALKFANEINLSLPQDDLKDIANYLCRNGMHYNYEENLKKYVVKHGLENS